MADVLMPVFVVSFAAIIVFSLPEAEFGELLPVLSATPPSKLFHSSYTSLSWYTGLRVSLIFHGALPL